MILLIKISMRVKEWDVREKSEIVGGALLRIRMHANSIEPSDL